MSRTWLIIDSDYLAWRAFHTTGVLSHKDVRTGVVYGFLRDITTLQEMHNTDNLVFCFDFGKNLRANDYPNYKAGRRNKERPQDEVDLIIDMKRQLKLLRTQYLKDLGFRNIFWERGYEADDIVASVSLNLPKPDEGIIIGSDHDLYQLLTKRVILWNPTSKKAVTQDSFEREYGVTPTQWVDVKAIAGCKTDDIVGVKGVGEKTACKFLTGSLKSESKQFQAIIQGKKRWDHNRFIVKLPYPGTPVFELRKNRVSRDAWEDLADSLGMKTIRELAPVGRASKGFGL